MPTTKAFNPEEAYEKLEGLLKDKNNILKELFEHYEKKAGKQLDTLLENQLTKNNYKLFLKYNTTVIQRNNLYTILKQQKKCIMEEINNGKI